MHPLEKLTLSYLSEIRDQRAKINSTDELSYRDYLGKFLRGMAQVLGKHADFTGEAKKITFGRPDYEVTNGLTVIGYVEAEALGTPLSRLKGSAKTQNERFRKNLHNFLLTNHTEFRLYVDEKEVNVISLPEPASHGAISVPASVLDALQTLLEAFLDASTPAAVTAEAIAKQLAHRAQFLRVAADQMLRQDDSPLHLYWNLYKQTLFDGIDKEKFADVYAQTFTYGLFLAWLNTSGMLFDRDTAIHALPRAVPAIRVLLQFGGGDDLPEEFLWIVDGICSDLEGAERTAVTRHRVAFDDPLIHFYEPFLAAYDPALRKRAGVYYTPDPVVDFIVRSVDFILKQEFGKNEGLVNTEVRLLDPATGTATFLARAYRQAHQTMIANGDGGVWADRARDHIAKHFYGFERLPAAYTLAHIKLRQLLTELDAPLPESVRLPVYLADTMMNVVPPQLNLPGADVLSKEARAAKQVRDQQELLVVLGNPPYSGKSDNPSRDLNNDLTFIGNLIEDYKYVDGQRIKDRGGLKWLQNDYVKFIRFAQWRIEQSEQGMVAFITDNSYLDNRTHRGMRQQLLQHFDDIYIFNLHGNSLRKEKSPDGTTDENVFDIQEGVAIAVFIRRKGNNPRCAKLHYKDLYGPRSHKYKTLLSATLSSLDERIFDPQGPLYLFVPPECEPKQENLPEMGQEDAIVKEYLLGWNVADIFNQISKPAPGILTTQDDFAISYSREEAIAKVERLLKTVTEEEARQEFKLCKQDQWQYARAKIALGDNKWRDELVQIESKPFDKRWTVFNPNVAVHLRERVMRHMLSGDNIGLVTTRATKDVWTCMVSDTVIRHKALATYDVNFLFPLYRDPEKNGLGIETREANLNPAFVKEITERIGFSPSPEQIFNYMYAVFHSPTYRKRYASCLRTDFPRLPIPLDAVMFSELAMLGEKLVKLHLLEAAELQHHGIVFPVSGDHYVKKMRVTDRYLGPTPDGKPGRVRLNDTEYFDNVPPQAWEYLVGGYQPAAQWLDDRAERCLSESEILRYRHMIAAMRETITLLPAIDVSFARMLTTIDDVNSTATLSPK